jgi:hypothetical protein
MAFPRSVPFGSDFLYINAQIVNPGQQAASGRVAATPAGDPAPGPDQFYFTVQPGMAFPAVGWSVDLTNAITGAPITSSPGTVVVDLDPPALYPSQPAPPPSPLPPGPPPPPLPPPLQLPQTVLVTMNVALPTVVGGTYALLQSPGLNSGNGSIPFLFVENRIEDILPVPDDYVCAVESFRAPLTHVPLFFVPKSAVLTGLFIGRLTITVGANTFTTDVNVVPDNPLAPGGNGMGAVYQYKTIVDAVNSALGRVATLAGVAAPRLLLDYTTGLFTLAFPQGVYQPDAAGGASLFFDSQLYNLFNTLPAVYQLTQGNTPNSVFAWKMQSSNTGTNGYLAPAVTDTGGGLTPGSYWIMQQQVSSQEIINQMDSIVITSALPSQLENMPGAESLTGGRGLFLDPAFMSNPGNTNLRPTLLEWAIPTRPTGQGQPSPLVFNATDETRRYVSLGGKQPVRNLSVFMYLQDRRLNLYLLPIPENDYGFCKVQIRSKRSLAIYKAEEPPVNVRRIPH